MARSTEGLVDIRRRRTMESLGHARALIAVVQGGLAAFRPLAVLAATTMIGSTSVKLSPIEKRYTRARQARQK
jgi:hypothetical protein